MSCSRPPDSSSHHISVQLRLIWRHASGTLRPAPRAFLWFAFSSSIAAGAKGPAVGLKRPALSGPPVKQRRIVLQLQQHARSLLGFRDSFLRGIETSFLVRAFATARLAQPSDISVAHMEFSCSNIQVITVAHLLGPGEGNDAEQKIFRTIAVAHYYETCPLQDVEAVPQQTILLRPRADAPGHGPALLRAEHEPPHEEDEEGSHR